jgi:hypothetical protein
MNSFHSFSSLGAVLKAYDFSAGILETTSEGKVNFA